MAMQFRTLVWLIALIAFLAPSFGAGAAMHPVAPQERASLADCPDHAPPPADPCPDHGTAKHAAGQCCPMMSCTFAVLPPASADNAQTLHHIWLAAPVRSLTGLTFTQDPPPPRV